MAVGSVYPLSFAGASGFNICDCVTSTCAILLRSRFGETRPQEQAHSEAVIFSWDGPEPAERLRDADVVRFFAIHYTPALHVAQLS